jgi:NAD(P)-dependent dehydrogenase (short-subunit alcohol dehydrogenase family)
LNGKNVLITGASRGIGKATAISYAKAGTSGIALAARSSLEGIVKEVKEAAASSGHPKPKVLNLEVDVTDRASVEASAKEVSEAFNGVLDVLINNAGYLSSFAGILDSNPDDWWRNYEVNVKGVYLVTRAFFPMLVKSTSKIVINITSIGALTLVPGISAYGTSKLAILRFTEFVTRTMEKEKREW